MSDEQKENLELEGQALPDSGDLPESDDFGLEDIVHPTAEDFDDGMGPVSHDDTGAVTPEDTDGTDGEETGGDDPNEDGVEFSSNLLGLASQFGVSEEEARQFPSETALQQALFLMSRQQRVSAENAVPAPKDDEKVEDEFKPYEVPLDPEEYDKAYVDTLKGMSEHQAAAFKQMHGELRELRTHVSRQVEGERVRSAQEFETRFDGFIGENSDTYREILGEGRGFEMDKSTKAYANRVKLLNEMAVVAAGIASTGDRMPDERVIFEKAARALFGDVVVKGARHEIAKKLDGRKQNFTNRPSGKLKQSAPDPDREANEFAKGFMKEIGAYDD